MDAPLTDWFGLPLPEPVTPPQPDKNTNPCIALHGPGPVGQTCKGCVHLRYPLHHSGRYWKCDLRRVSHGSATDHKVSWPACARYEKREGEYHGG
jgi:hypothetical protein